MEVSGIQFIYIASIASFCIGGFVYFDGVSIARAGTRKSKSYHDTSDGERIVIESSSEISQVVASGNSSKKWGLMTMIMGALLALFGLLTY